MPELVHGVVSTRPLRFLHPWTNFETSAKTWSHARTVGKQPSCCILHAEAPENKPFIPLI